MSELSQKLKALVSQYPGTMAELSHKAQIDRSTIYKFGQGQRVPQEDQLQRLCTALNVSPNTQASLMEIYRQEVRGTDPLLREEMHALLNMAFRTEWLSGRGNMPNEVAAALPDKGSYVEGEREVESCLASLVGKYLVSGDTRPLMLAPFTNPILDKVLLERFAEAEGGEPVPLWQLLLFTEESAHTRERVADIRVLTRTLPFLFIEKMHYEAHGIHCVATEPSPGTLMPVYLLLPDAAVFMDRAGKKATVLREAAVVENLRLAFNRKFLEAPAFLTLCTETHAFTESMQLYGKLIADRPSSCLVRYQPPFTLFAECGMAQQVLRDTIPDAQMAYFMNYLEGWTRLEPDLYFCEEGLLEFARTGIMLELPEEHCQPMPPELRRELLLRLRKAVETEDRALRIVDPTYLTLTPSMSVNVFTGRGVVFCRATMEDGRSSCREYLMKDNFLTSAMQSYFDDLIHENGIRSQKYTLDFIDYCLRLV